MAVIRLKDGRWIVYYRDWRPDGTAYLKREYFGRGHQAEAAARARDKHLNLGFRRPQASPAEGPAFAEIAREYFAAHRFASPAARDRHLNRMASRLLPFFGCLPATRVDDSCIDRYISERRRDGVADATIRRELVDLKAIFNFASRRRPPLIAFNPVRDYRIPRETLDVIMPPTDAEFEAILQASPAHLRRILLLSYYIGLRPGPVECYRLRWENCDFGANTILITGAKKGGQAKRLVPIHPEFAPLMRQWHKIDEAGGIPWVVHWGGKTIATIATAWRNKPLAEVVGSRPETLMRYYQHVSAAAHRHTVNLIPPAPGNNTDFSLSPRKRKKRCIIKKISSVQSP